MTHQGNSFFRDGRGIQLHHQVPHPQLENLNEIGPQLYQYTGEDEDLEFSYSQLQHCPLREKKERIISDDWKQEELDGILKGHKAYGHKWTRIANLIQNGRTERVVKNWFYSFVRRVVRKIKRNTVGLCEGEEKHTISHIEYITKYIKDILYCKNESRDKKKMMKPRKKKDPYVKKLIEKNDVTQEDLADFELTIKKAKLEQDSKLNGPIFLVSKLSKEETDLEISRYWEMTKEEEGNKEVKLRHRIMEPKKEAILSSNECTEDRKLPGLGAFLGSENVERAVGQHMGGPAERVVVVDGGYLAYGTHPYAYTQHPMLQNMAHMQYLERVAQYNHIQTQLAKERQKQHLQHMANMLYASIQHVQHQKQIQIIPNYLHY